MPDFPLRIATRGSPLALAQAEQVKSRLAAAHGLGTQAFEIVVVRTTGDRIVDRPLTEAGGKGLFTKEIEEALLDGRADLAVHSAKDMPTVLPDGLGLAALLPREDVRDAFISRLASSFEGLPEGAVLGTTSLRRAALARRLRPDLQVVPLRGNVRTRIDKLERGEVDATLLALAGLKRLGMADEATALLDIESFPPALGQGAIAVETLREGEMHGFVAMIDDFATSAAIACERAFLEVLEGSCRTPIAGHAAVENNRLAFYGLVLSADGATSFETRQAGDPARAAELGAEAGREIVVTAGEAFLAELRHTP